MKYLLANVWLQGYENGMVWNGAEKVREEAIVLHKPESEPVHEYNRAWAGERVPGRWYAEYISR